MVYQLPVGWLSAPPTAPAKAAATPTPEERSQALLDDVRRGAEAHAAAVAKAVSYPEGEVPTLAVQDVLNAGNALDVYVCHALKFHTVEALVEAIPELHPGYVAEMLRGGPF